MATPESRLLARRIVGLAQAGEQVEVCAGTSTRTEVRVHGGAVESLTVAESRGVGVRVVRDGREGFAHAGTFAPDVVDDLLAEARDNLEFAEPDDRVGLAEPDGVAPADIDPWDDRIESTPVDDKVGLALALEAATFKFISDPTAAFAAMMAGDIDAFPGYPAPETLPQFEADPRFQVMVGSTEGETILSTNNKSEKLRDLRVRKAIAHAIDRQAIIDGAMFGYGTPIGTHFAPHHPDYIDLTEQSSYDPAKSRALLKDAGAENLTLSLKLPPPSYARRGGEIIAAQLREVGINTTIENLEWAQWLEYVFRGKDFDLSIVSHTEPMDIGIYANPDYYFQYESAEFQGLMDDLKIATDPAQRSALLAKAQQRIADDYVNGYLFQLARTGVANAKINGLWTNAPTQANDLTAVTWAE